MAEDEFEDAVQTEEVEKVPRECAVLSAGNEWGKGDLRDPADVQIGSCEVAREHGAESEGEREGKFDLSQWEALEQAY